MTRSALALLLLAAAAPAAATDAFDPAAAVPCETKRWAKTERLEDADPNLEGDRHSDWTQHHDPEVVAAFGEAKPPSTRFLLHYAEGWDAPSQPVPVLLVHGAGLTANHCFADRPIEQPYPGLAAHLAEHGRAVFAVTFAHGHGDNFRQAEIVADAIARVLQVTGADRVDLVAHSKGGMPCRIYLSNAGPKWATRYRGDVRRYVMLGTPNGGIDVSFAYPNLNYWILENKLGPAQLDRGPLLRSVGQVRRAGADVGLLPRPAPDGRPLGPALRNHRAVGQLDVAATYEGGRGQVCAAIGIDRAIEAGGDAMAKLATKGIDPRVELAVLAGVSPWTMHLIGERRGPSDGLLLVASALDTDPLTRRGAKLLGRTCGASTTFSSSTTRAPTPGSRRSWPSDRARAFGSCQ